MDSENRQICSVTCVPQLQPIAMSVLHQGITCSQKPICEQSVLGLSLELCCASYPLCESIQITEKHIHTGNPLPIPSLNYILFFIYKLMRQYGLNKWGSSYNISEHMKKIWGMFMISVLNIHQCLGVPRQACVMRWESKPLVLPSSQKDTRSI